MNKLTINGTERVIDRLQNFDERSRNYSIAPVIAGKTPRSYTWRCNTWLDQGTEGACVAYALGHELASRPAEVKGLNDKWLKESVYWEAQKIDPWPGGAYPGTPSFYEGTSVLSGIKILQKLGLFKEYRWAFSFDDLVLGIGRNGPAVLGINWYEGMGAPDSKNFITPTGAHVGGHAILARAVDVKERVITLRNSWGQGWGDNGDCYIKFDDLRNIVQQGGEAAFIIKRKTNVIL